MAMRGVSLSVRLGSPLALTLVLAACTPGGQFDPTTLFDSSVFDTKKTVQGQREPLFPNGVPGAETGVPPDLVKGYKPPPDQANADAAPDAAPPDDQNTAPPPKRAEAPPKPKPKPKPKLARAPAQPQDPAFDQKRPTRIDVGRGPTPAAAPAGGGSNAQSVWPSAPPQQAAQPSQSVWPAPPQTAPTQQAAQPAQSIWPNPPATGTSTQ